MTAQQTDLSLTRLIQRFWKKAIFTWILVLGDGLLHLLFPLIIGRAIDGLLQDDHSGLIELGVLCGLVLFTGAGQRYYDTRVYAGIYRTVSAELVERENRKGSDVSKISARASLFEEFIQFLEDSLPRIIHQLINFTGTLILIAWIDPRIFALCAVGAIVTILVFALSEKKITQFHKGLNDEKEKQVTVISRNHPVRVDRHFRNMMHWNVRLSDLETWNYSLIWLALTAVLLASIAMIVGAGDGEYGQMIAAVMYVFGFIDSVLIFPLFYQQLLRLGDIGRRLSAD